MIIRYPTGAYRDVLPSKESDIGNVTFTVSNTSPPRSSLTFPKIPFTIALRETKPTPKSKDPSKYGELSITINKTKANVIRSNAKSYDVGQILEFAESALVAIKPMLVVESIEDRHDTNIYNLSNAGLTDVDRAVLTTGAQASQAIIRDKLNEAIRSRSNAEVEINNLQKQINEATKAKQAAEITMGLLVDKDAISQIITKLSNSIDANKKAYELAVKKANEAADLSDSLRSQYLALNNVVNNV